MPVQVPVMLAVQGGWSVKRWRGVVQLSTYHCIVTITTANAGVHLVDTAAVCRAPATAGKAVVCMLLCSFGRYSSDPAIYREEEGDA
jgi:hypothetical protein